ncbi:MAG: hypothetical protein WCH65_07085 [bacterium]
MPKQKITPSQLFLQSVTYQQILNGKLPNLPFMTHQVGILKEICDFCFKDGNDNFVPISSVEISRRLQQTPIARLMPKDGISQDIVILENRGWLNSTPNGMFLFSDHAKDMLKK